EDEIMGSRFRWLWCLACVLLASCCKTEAPPEEGVPTGDPKPQAVGEVKPLGPGSAPMFGGGPSRNMVNLVDKNLPTQFSASEKSPKNIKWSAKLGIRSYGGPVIAGGRIFVGTNNSN